MAKEILAVPEENLAEVIAVIQAGLRALGKDVSEDVRHNLMLWCEWSKVYYGEQDTVNDAQTS